MKGLRVIDCAYDARVSEQTVRRWISAGKLQATEVRIGRPRYEIDKAEWDRFCDEHGIEKGAR